MCDVLDISTDTLFEIIKKWLNENSGKFPAMPYLRGTSSGTILCRYTGITQFISVSICSYGIRVNVQLDSENYDALIDLDVIPANDKKGNWYCEMCYHASSSDGKRKSMKGIKRYQTFEDFYIDHVLVPWFEWSRENIRQEYYLEICRTGDCGSSWARIVKEPGGINPLEELFGKAECSLIKMNMFI